MIRIFSLFFYGCRSKELEIHSSCHISVSENGTFYIPMILIIFLLMTISFFSFFTSNV